MILRESKKKLKKIWGRPSDIKSRFTGNIGNSAGIEPLVAPRNRPSLKRQRWLRRTYRVVHQWGCFLTTILHWGLRNCFFLRFIYFFQFLTFISFFYFDFYFPFLFGIFFFQFEFQFEFQLDCFEFQFNYFEFQFDYLEFQFDRGHILDFFQSWS